MQLRLSLSAVLATALLVGCAHPIVITPDVSQIDRTEVKPIECNVGYFISQPDREKEVTTPGGGGDKVRYFPYKELEPALFKALSNVFRRAYPMNSALDAEAIKTKDITFVFVPEVTTDSSSSSAFTWPPTKFTVNLNCKAFNREGKQIWESKITGNGEATFSEFKSDLPLAAKRASLKAMQDFQKALNTAPELRTK